MYLKGGAGGRASAGRRSCRRRQILPGRLPRLNHKRTKLRLKHLWAARCEFTDQTAPRSALRLLPPGAPDRAVLRCRTPQRRRKPAPPSRQRRPEISTRCWRCRASRTRWNAANARWRVAVARWMCSTTSRSACCRATSTPPCRTVRDRIAGRGRTGQGRAVLSLPRSHLPLSTGSFVETL